MSMQNKSMHMRPAQAVLEVATHDTMAAVRHVAALLARRAYPLLALTCLPESENRGRLVVAVADDGRVDRLAIELAALPEVISTRLADAAEPGLYAMFGAAIAA